VHLGSHHFLVRHLNFLLCMVLVSLYCAEGISEQEEEGCSTGITLDDD